MLAYVNGLTRLQWGTTPSWSGSSIRPSGAPQLANEELKVVPYIPSGTRWYVSHICYACVSCVRLLVILETGCLVPRLHSFYVLTVSLIGLRRTLSLLGLLPAWLLLAHEDIHDPFPTTTQLQIPKIYCNNRASAGPPFLLLCTSPSLSPSLLIPHSLNLSTYLFPSPSMPPSHNPSLSDSYMIVW